MFNSRARPCSAPPNCGIVDGMDADESSIREDDKELATRLSTRDDVSLKAAELLQLAAIYAALPEERRRLWFARLSSEGVSPELLAQIVARAGRMIRFPDIV